MAEKPVDPNLNKAFNRIIPNDLTVEDRFTFINKIDRLGQVVKRAIGTGKNSGSHTSKKHHHLAVQQKDAEVTTWESGGDIDETEDTWE